MFKIGDRVRLKAWVTDKVFSGSKTSFRQGDVGRVTRERDSRSGFSECVGVESNRAKHVDHWHMIAVEDLEIMPERQVHIVKGGKVYELREWGPIKTQHDCRGMCDLSANQEHRCEIAGSGVLACVKSGVVYKEVKSGKVVS